MLNKYFLFIFVEITWHCFPKHWRLFSFNFEFLTYWCCTNNERQTLKHITTVPSSSIWWPVPLILFDFMLSLLFFDNQWVTSHIEFFSLSSINFFKAQLYTPDTNCRPSLRKFTCVACYLFLNTRNFMSFYFNNWDWDSHNCHEQVKGESHARSLSHESRVG